MVGPPRRGRHSRQSPCSEVLTGMTASQKTCRHHATAPRPPEKNEKNRPYLRWRRISRDDHVFADFWKAARGPWGLFFLAMGRNNRPVATPAPCSPITLPLRPARLRQADTSRDPLPVVVVGGVCRRPHPIRASPTTFAISRPARGTLCFSLRVSRTPPSCAEVSIPTVPQGGNNPLDYRVDETGHAGEPQRFINEWLLDRRCAPCPVLRRRRKVDEGSTAFLFTKLPCSQTKPTNQR